MMNILDIIQLPIMDTISSPYNNIIIYIYIQTLFNKV